MNHLLFNLNADAALAEGLIHRLGLKAGGLRQRRFPDGESYLRILESERDVQGCRAIVLASLSPPDSQLMPMLQAAGALRDLGAAHITLIAPYLPYMRQDIAFESGEAVSARLYPRHLALAFDRLITVDPHLHRIHDLHEVFDGECQVASAASALAEWIQGRIERPFLIGPDEESRQWVAQVAAGCEAPFAVLSKVRHGDRDVEISVPRDALEWRGTPVLVDDMISTGHTMIEAVRGLRARRHAPVCVVTHALFDPAAEAALRDAGVAQVVSSNSLVHPSNKIDLSPIIAAQLKNGFDS